VLWYSSPITIAVEGPAAVSVSYERTGDPAFAADGYHLTAPSAAIDRGVWTGLHIDIDGDARPDRCIPDLGADEFISGLDCEHVYLPSLLRLSP
jgi:hypothetical protein